MNPIYEFLITTGENLFSYWAGDATIGAVLSLGGNTVENSAFNTSGYMKVTPGSRVQFGLCYNYVFTMPTKYVFRAGLCMTRIIQQLRFPTMRIISGRVHGLQIGRISRFTN